MSRCRFRNRVDRTHRLFRKTFAIIIRKTNKNIERQETKTDWKLDKNYSKFDIVVLYLLAQREKKQRIFISHFKLFFNLKLDKFRNLTLLTSNPTFWFLLYLHARMEFYRFD